MARERPDELVVAGEDDGALRQLRAEGLELEIAFNLSPRQLWQPDLVNKIISPMVIAGIPFARAAVAP